MDDTKINILIAAQDDPIVYNAQCGFFDLLRAYTDLRNSEAKLLKDLAATRPEIERLQKNEETYLARLKVCRAHMRDYNIGHLYPGADAEREERLKQDPTAGGGKTGVMLEQIQHDRNTIGELNAQIREWELYADQLGILMRRAGLEVPLNPREREDLQDEPSRFREVNL